MEVFGGSGEDARRALFGMGVIIALKKRGTFMEYLLDQHPAEVFATTSRPGWHESGAFVLPGRTIGSDKVRYQASNKAQVLFSRRGELALWQSEVAAKCAGNPVLTLAIGCSLAGPLLSLVGVLGGGVHLVGDSSSGKSLAQLIGSSVWGDPGVFAASWDMTKGGLEIEASSRNDTILPLDEIKRADPKRVQEMAYSLANGQPSRSAGGDAVLFGFAAIPIGVALGQGPANLQRLDDAGEAEPVGGFDERGLVEQEQSLIGDHLPVPCAVENLSVRLWGIHVGESAAAVLVDKVDDAGQYLAVFGVPSADTGKPFAVEQAAVGEGGTRLPREQSVGDGHLASQCNHGKPVSDTARLGVVFDELGSDAVKVTEQPGLIVSGDQALNERWPKVAMVGADRHGELPVEVSALKPVQLIEGPVCPCTGVHVDHAQLGASVGGIAGNGGVLGERALAAGKGQQAPAQFGAAFTLTGHGAFALYVIDPEALDGEGGAV